MVKKTSPADVSMRSSSFFCLTPGLEWAMLRLVRRSCGGRVLGVASCIESRLRLGVGPGRKFSDDREGCREPDSFRTSSFLEVLFMSASSAERSCVGAKDRFRSESPLRCRSLRFCASRRGRRGSESDDIVQACRDRAEVS